MTAPQTIHHREWCARPVPRLVMHPSAGPVATCPGCGQFMKAPDTRATTREDQE